MRTRSVAVIGAGVGGLTAAAWLARAGHAVTVFEQESVVGGKAQQLVREGVTLDTGPTLLAMPETVRSVFEEMGGTDLLPRFTDLALQCRYHWSDGRTFSAYRSAEASEASAEAYQAGEGSALQRFYAQAAAIHRAAGEPYLEAPYEGMAEFLSRALSRGPKVLLRGLKLGTLDDLARRCFASPGLRQFAGRFATYTGASPYRASAAFALIAHLERVHGVHHVHGGIAALVQAIAKTAARHGAELLLGARATWARDNDRFRVGPAGSERTFDALVMNADPLVALDRAKGPLALSGYVLLLRVEGAVDLPHHSILFAREPRPEFEALFGGVAPTDTTVYVCHPAATDPSMAPPQGQASGLYVMVNAPPLADGAALDDESRARLKAQCLDAIFAQWPSLRGRVRVLGERTPEDLRRQGAPGGSIYGFVPHGLFGPFRRPRMRGPVPNFFFAGGGTHPGGGVPLAMLSGSFAARLAHASLTGATRVGVRAA